MHECIKCIELEPNEYIFYYKKGIILNKLERFTEAIEFLGKSIETNATLDWALLLNPNHKGYHDLKLNAFIKKSKWFT